MKATCAGLAGLAATLLVAHARADILEWRDEKGGSHFTNLPDEIPKDRRFTTRVVVDEPDSPPVEDAGAVAVKRAPARRAQSEREEPRRQAMAIYDLSRSRPTYEDGLRRGIELGRGGSGGAVESPVPRAPVPNVVAVPYPYLPPVCGPPVGRGFDGGRWRHRTFRLKEQEACTWDGYGGWAPAPRYPPLVVVGPSVPRDRSRFPIPKSKPLPRRP